MSDALEPIRQKIDALDHDLVRLLNERLGLAAEIGKVKRSSGGSIYASEREDKVLRKVCGLNEGPIKDEALKAIYREIMSAAIALEKATKIVYLGPEATNTHAAAIKKFGASIDYEGMGTIADLFTAVEKGEADYAVIPIENSTEGSVREALDNFVESDLKIVAQIYLEISHSLISNESLEGITKVYSKDQALAQCRHWLQRHLPHAQLIDASSTARAVEIAANEPGAAAVAGELAAQHHDVPVIAANIQDKSDNTTRFFVLGKKPAGAVGSGRDMSSFLISLGDQASSHSGALLKMLMPMAERGINLSKIESRPSKRRPWDYYFFVDVSGHYQDANMQEALSELSAFCPMVKWLGSYPVVN
ncbi:prephenate dehydratase [Synoicihabitans lomoniglobus]|uniref:Bifunctional chorismate mutase/prephenate dehydratase n=1 Tax=Synoicihabitans lomoniglobus TaxID=2909285 RepID=A0AAF0CS50_9BACT|nr:prephenate dehydratase [Opitutaceae bacterium LMO-M01]WED67027.1 prephenate dehydratase [Opitutaceae bacterium LMO-M01]